MKKLYVKRITDQVRRNAPRFIPLEEGDLIAERGDDVFIKHEDGVYKTEKKQLNRKGELVVYIADLTASEEKALSWRKYKP